MGLRIKVITVPMPSANTEYSWHLPIGLKFFTIRARGEVGIRVSTERDRVATSNDPYFTIDAGAAWDEDDLNIQNDDLFFYFACSSGGNLVEIIAGIGGS